MLSVQVSVRAMANCPERSADRQGRCARRDRGRRQGKGERRAPHQAHHRYDPPRRARLDGDRDAQGQGDGPGNGAGRVAEPLVRGWPCGRSRRRRRTGSRRPAAPLAPTARRRPCRALARRPPRDPSRPRPPAVPGLARGRRRRGGVAVRHDRSHEQPQPQQVAPRAVRAQGRPRSGAPAAQGLSRLSLSMRSSKSTPQSNTPQAVAKVALSASPRAKVPLSPETMTDQGRLAPSHVTSVLP